MALSWLLVPLLCDPVFSLAHSSIFNSSFLLQSVPAGALVVAFVLGDLLPKGLSQVFAIGFISLLLAASSDLRCFFRAVGTSLPLHPHRLPSG